MDSKSGTSSANKSPLWGIRFRHWLGGVLVDMRRKSPVQQWVDSIPRQDQKPVVRATSQDDISVTSETANQVVSPLKSVNIQSSSAPVCLNKRDKFLSSGSNEDSDVFEMGTSARTDACEPKLDLYSSSVDSTLVKRTKPPFFRDRSINSEGNSPRHKNALFRDSSLQRGVSFQSEGATSRASSVESLLESRRVDAEAVLRGVGFGPSPARQQLARIPDRFLKPSQVKGVSTEQFIKEEQKSMKLHECGVFGYRGLTGHPHVPPSSIVAKIIERISSSEEIPDPRILHSSGQAAPRQSDIDTF